MRAYRVTNTGKLDVLAMRIPSKVGGFNSDYYPPFHGNESSTTAEAWCAGENVPAKTMQLSATKSVTKTKKSGLNRLKKGGADATSAPEEAKGEDAAALRA